MRKRNLFYYFKHCWYEMLIFQQVKALQEDHWIAYETVMLAIINDQKTNIWSILIKPYLCIPIHHKKESTRTVKPHWTGKVRNRKERQLLLILDTMSCIHMHQKKHNWKGWKGINLSTLENERQSLDTRYLVFYAIHQKKQNYRAY